MQHFHWGLRLPHCPSHNWPVRSYWRFYPLHCFLVPTRCKNQTICFGAKDQKPSPFLWSFLDAILQLHFISHGQKEPLKIKRLIQLRPWKLLKKIIKPIGKVPLHMHANKATRSKPWAQVLNISFLPFHFGLLSWPAPGWPCLPLSCSGSPTSWKRYHCNHCFPHL